MTKLAKLERDIDQIGRKGRAAWKRLKKSTDWNDWMSVGEALVAGRGMARRGAGVNKPEGRGYNELFSQWLIHYGLQEIDKSDRAKLFKVMDRRSEIEEYRLSLSLPERCRLNHPTTVLRHWTSATKVTKPRPPKVSVDQENDDLRAQIDELTAARESPKPLSLDQARAQYVAHFADMTGKEKAVELTKLRDAITFDFDIEVTYAV
jgi:hypothetical protein